ncbi:MAG: hypothetical protein JSW51_01490 [Gemmatimonadota bacterium]|nr:MAG: hypothetical protein JSW51_01490 [Gemmatimonadota bacterium]
MTASPERNRLKFVDFDFSILPSGRCRSRVVLEWKEGTSYEGAAEGLGSQTGELRCAAEATVQALEQAVNGKVKMELLGVKAVRAFDAVVVIVSLSCHNGSAQRVVGSYLSEDELPRGAALAVLNATNRLLGNIVFTR